MLVTAVERVAARAILSLTCPFFVRQRQQRFVPLLDHPLSLRFRENGSGGGECRRGDCLAQNAHNINSQNQQSPIPPQPQSLNIQFHHRMNLPRSVVGRGRAFLCTFALLGR